MSLDLTAPNVTSTNAIEYTRHLNDSGNWFLDYFDLFTMSGIGEEKETIILLKVCSVVAQKTFIQTFHRNFYGIYKNA